MIDDLFMSDEPWSLLDDYPTEEATLRRAGDVNPLIEPSEVGESFSRQSPPLTGRLCFKECSFTSRAAI